METTNPEYDDHTSYPSQLARSTLRGGTLALAKTMARSRFQLQVEAQLEGRRRCYYAHPVAVVLSRRGLMPRNRSRWPACCAALTRAASKSRGSTVKGKLTACDRQPDTTLISMPVHWSQLFSWYSCKPPGGARGKKPHRNVPSYYGVRANTRRESESTERDSWTEG